MAKSKLELQLELKQLRLAISKANTAKEEIDVKTLEAEVNVERLRNHQKLQDVRIAEVKLEIVRVENLIRNYKEENNED